MRFVDTFAGVGGFRLGLEALGHEHVASVEINKYARQTYAENFGDHGLFEDIYDVTAEQLGEFDILTGGFPCQSFSEAGHRRGTDDARGVLFLELIRLAQEGRPKVVIGENVRGILHDKHKEMRAAYYRLLDEAGYDTQHEILTASDFGVPQKRVRVFFISILRGCGLKWVPPLVMAPPTCKLADILEPEESIDERHYVTDKQMKQFVEYQARNRAKGNGFGYKIVDPDKPANTFPAIYGRQGGNTHLVQIGHIKNNSIQNRVYDSQGLGRTLNACSGGGGIKTGLYQVGYLGGEGKRGDGNGYPGKRVYDPASEVGKTITTASGGDIGLYRFGHRIRRLTPREAFRLMGFPDTFRLPCSDAQTYKQAGNAVVPQVVTAVAEGLHDR